MGPGMDTHGTPVPTQCGGRGWLHRTHKHMAPEHATDTKVSKSFIFMFGALGPKPNKHIKLFKLLKFCSAPEDRNKVKNI